MATAKKAAKKATSGKTAAAALQGKSNLPAVVATGALQLPEGFKIKRALQLPTMKMNTGDQRVILFQSDMRVSNVQNKKKEALATVAEVVDFQTGESFIWMIPAVVESTLVQTYAPEGTMTYSGEDRFKYDERREAYSSTPVRGLLFAVRNAGKKEGKRHTDWEVLELDAPTTKRIDE